MRMYDVIMKKREGKTLTPEEIRFVIRGYTEGSIPDYQMSAFLMAVFFQGMTDEETAVMTLEMAHSGETADLSGIQGVKVDKHSTGGVGDKTTLIVAPIAAACGCKVAKMSGRGLGHTGGTVDKMEAIPGMRTSLSQEAFVEIVNRVGISVTGQSGNLAPADKKIYALRDVTATVESIPLIASSIMSKKLAAGSSCILLDVKLGNGAFMKTKEDALKLAKKMVAIGEQNGRRTAALITNMDYPLGWKIGNALEVQEAVETLRGKGPEDLTQVSLALAENMLYLAGKGTMAECRAMAERAIESGAALKRLGDMVEAQGGDPDYIFHPERFGEDCVKAEILSDQEGYLYRMDTEGIGTAAMLLGAGREKKEDSIDPLAGIVLCRKTGAYLKAGERIAVFYTSSQEKLREAEKKFRDSLTIQREKPEAEPLVYARVTKEGVEEPEE